MIKEKQLQAQHLIVKMLNDRCLIVLHAQCPISHIHVVIVAHLNNFSEIQIYDEPEHQHGGSQLLSYLKTS